MARPRTIDREKLLDAAEQVLTGGGAGALSFGSIAEAAGVSKASVQSAFGTREHLLEALIGRGMAEEDKRFEQELAQGARSRLDAHILASEGQQTPAGRRTSVLLATLIASGGQSEAMREWYGRRLGPLSATTEVERRERLVYLATEGAFLLRNLMGVDINDHDWHEIFRDLQKMEAQ